MTRRAAADGHRTEMTGVADNYAGLIEEVRQVNRHPVAAAPAPNPLLAKVGELGGAAINAARELTVFLEMLGSMFLALANVLRRPRSLRLTSLTYQLYRVGFQAIPIMVLITFLIGAIIAQQGFFHFRKFGADSYVVDMVGILVLRELGVLIVAIMVAVRSGSAYTAELGSMKMREEIDALSTMGLDPVEVLILPRVIALVCALPILSFIGSMAALYGGGLVAQFYGGMGPAIYIARLHEAVSVTHFEVGIIKAPFMALVRHRRLQRRLAGEGLGGIAWQADHDLGCEIDLPGDRARRPVRGVLCIDRNVAMQEMTPQFAIRVHDLVVSFGRQVVIDHLSLDVRKSEILGLVGASGGGKSVLMRTIIGRFRRSGEIEVMGAAIGKAKTDHAGRRGKMGILFIGRAVLSPPCGRTSIRCGVCAVTGA
jgi:ABC transport permease subunit